MPHAPKPIEGANAARFASKIRPTPTCWEWMGARFSTGYGAFKVGRQMRKAHRVMWTLEHGEIPPGSLVLHTCDNRGCVRPEHLYLGSHGENMRDRNERGRSARGERDGLAKLTTSAVVALRAPGAPVLDLAARFGVAEATAYQARRGRTWRHVPPRARA